MKDKDYNNLLQFKNMQGSALIPHNAASLEFLEQLKRDEIVTLKNVTARDIKLHDCYFVLLAEVWGYMPKPFRDKIPKKYFYNWLKMYQGKYNILYKFKSGITFVDLESISFGRMSNQSFKDFVKEQIPVLYEIMSEVLPDDMAVAAIETVEENFEKMFAKL